MFIRQQLADPYVEIHVVWNEKQHGIGHFGGRKILGNGKVLRCNKSNPVYYSAFPPPPSLLQCWQQNMRETYILKHRTIKFYTGRDASLRHCICWMFDARRFIYVG